MSIPSLSRQLDGAFEKVRQAGRHIHSLSQAEKSFRKHDPYAVGVEQFESDVLPQIMSRRITRKETTSPSGLIIRSSETRDFVKSWDVVVTLTPRPRFKPRMLQWGSIVGDIVHNLASALDNLVWELARANKPIWPPPAPSAASSKDRAAHTRHLRELGFPYTKKATDWPAHVTRYLFFVDQVFLGPIEKAQPFSAGQKLGVSPDHHPLAVLHDLWNRDKHHTVNLAMSSGEFQSVKLRIPNLFPELLELPTERLKTFPMRPIEGKTETAVLRVHFPHEIEAGASVHAQVDSDFTLAILFGKGSPAEGENVIDLLQRARDDVADLLNTFV